MPLFLDASALARRYMHEHGSTARMKEITGRFDRWGGFVVSSLIEPEVISAFARYARKPEHAADARAHHLRRHPLVVDAFRSDLSKAAFTTLRLTDDQIEAAADLLKRHPEYNIGAADAIHLVTALEIQPVIAVPLVFVTAVNGLEEAARAQGLRTLNPLREGMELLEAMDPPLGDPSR